jgi:hypothetical protein
LRDSEGADSGGFIRDSANNPSGGNTALQILNNFSYARALDDLRKR